MRTFVSSIVIAVFALSLGTCGAFAQRTWVSRNGTQANTASSCIAQFPCDLFVTALSVTPPGGEIDCLDSSDFGVVFITKSVTIDCSAQLGTIDPSAAFAGITINAPGGVVTLRGLSLNGAGISGNGITIQAAAAVTIENCVIQNYSGNASAGIIATTPLQLNITDTLITNNSNGGGLPNQSGGIVLFPSGSGPTGFVFERIRVDNNVTLGIEVNGQSTTGAVTGVIRDSVVTGSAHNGIFVISNSSNPVTVSLDHTHVAGNSIGITSANGAAVILNNTTVQTNGTGLAVSNGGVIFSYGNNPINGNQPNGSTTPILIGLH
jgi:hypothetical protein